MCTGTLPAHRDRLAQRHSPGAGEGGLAQMVSQMGFLEGTVVFCVGLRTHLCQGAGQECGRNDKNLGKHNY